MNKITKDVYMYALGAVVIAGFFIAVYLLLNNEIPSPNKEILYTLVGILGAKFSDVVNFFYGSSKGSSDKTDIIANGNKPKDEN